MDEKNDLIKVGKYDLRYNELLSIDIEELEIFRSKGLPAHMVKRKNFNCLKYIEYIKKRILKISQLSHIRGEYHFLPF